MKVLHPKAFFGLARQALKGWSADNCLSMGAALAFYSLLSMGPLLVLVITLAGLIIGREEAQQLLMTQMSGLLGDAGAEGVQNILQGAQQDKEGIFQVVVSFVVLLIGATTVLGELQDDLNRIWKCEAPKTSGIWGQVRKRLLSFSLILAIGMLLLVSLALSAFVSYLGGLWLSGVGTALARALEFSVSIVVTTALFAMTFKILPARRIPWSDVLLGSLMTAVLFAIGKYLIGLYIGKSAVASDFGAAGTVVVVILWIYYSSQIFFLGAEFTRAYSLRHGSKSPEAANSDYGNDVAMVERARRIVRGQDPVLVGPRKLSP